MADEIPEVDRTKRCMLSGNPETPEHREIDPRTEMQKDYVVLCPDERKKGFVRPVRRTYTHVGVAPEMKGIVLIKTGTSVNNRKRACGTNTTMGLALAETYARDPGFYGGTFCCGCGVHLPLDEFVWEGTNEKVGT